MDDFFKTFYKIGVIPVVATRNTSKMSMLSDALYDGGLPCAEITFRTEVAADIIQIMINRHPDMLIGAGTVLTTEQVDLAISAGAKFIVSPGLNPKTVKYCLKKNIPVLPGIQTPSEIEQALELGLDVVKFFPAELSGGIAMINALAAPYHNVKFIPTGGINFSNMDAYLKNEHILACGGSWMVTNNIIENDTYNEMCTNIKKISMDVKKIRNV